MRFAPRRETQRSETQRSEAKRNEAMTHTHSIPRLPGSLVRRSIQLLLVLAAATTACGQHRDSASPASGAAGSSGAAGATSYAFNQCGVAAPFPTNPGQCNPVA